MYKKSPFMTVLAALALVGVVAPDTALAATINKPTAATVDDCRAKGGDMCQPIVRFGYVCQPVFLQAAKAPARLTVSAYAKAKLLCRLSLPALLVIMVKPLRMVNSPSANRACGVSWTITAMSVLNVDFRVVKIKSGFPGAALSTRPRYSKEARKSVPTLSDAAPRRRDEKAGLISGFSFVNKVMGYEYKGYLSKKKHLFTMEIPIFSGG